MLEKITSYCRNVHNFVYEGSLSVYELILKTIVKEDEIIDYVNSLESTVSGNSLAINAKVDANKLQINNKVDNNQLLINAKVDSNFLDLNTRKENSSDITNNRKLSPLGDFTGNIHGKNSLLMLSELDTNTDQIGFLTEQFSDGATGLVIDCGFFEGGEIQNNYDGGMWR